ncbi:MAG: glycosyltransferase family 4 protein [Bacteroidetes bacterium]|nr:glycosyltransferase family 4 protein [Bacteroidota bacterium]
MIRSGKPYVVSTIFVDYAEYERRARSGLAGWIFRFFTPDQAEYLKVLARRIKSGEKIGSNRYIRWGHARSLRYVVAHSAMLLPNSQSEYNRLAAQYGIDHAFRVIPNGIDATLFKRPGHGTQREEDLVLCVGRIEGRKNQLNLIRGLQGSRFRLYIIGSPSANQRDYYDECRKYEGPQVRFINALSQEELIRYYATARVHVLPSWFETTGLSTLEAAAMGCNIVITDKGDTREYFESYAWYCDPASPASILDAVEQAATSPVPEALTEKIYTQYTWEAVARKTQDAYLEITGK